jgi:hypothetical protein
MVVMSDAERRALVLGELALEILQADELLGRRLRLVGRAGSTPPSGAEDARRPAS